MSNLHPHIAQILANFMLPALRRCTEPECCYEGQAAARSCGCMDDKLLAMTIDEPVLCNACAGSGEGFTENSTCWTCKGMGEVMALS